MAGQAGHVDYDAIPSIVYTWPELASVGMSEEEAARRKLEVRVGLVPVHSERPRPARSARPRAP